MNILSSNYKQQRYQCGELEYIIETLCVGYSIDRLKNQRERIVSMTNIDGPGLINEATFEELDMAIKLYYDDEYEQKRNLLSLQRDKVFNC